MPVVIGSDFFLEALVGSGGAVGFEEEISLVFSCRAIDPRAVRANIERLHAENPKGSVVIQADKKSTNNMLVIVMDASRAAGVFNVSIAANP